MFVCIEAMSLDFYMMSYLDSPDYGNFPVITRILLGKISVENDENMSYAYDKFTYHFQVRGGITYLCLADEDVPRRLIFSFLEDISGVWGKNFDDKDVSCAVAYAMNEPFSPILKEKMILYNSDMKSVDSIARVRSQIETVKDVMIENIDKLLERGEKIELLVEKTDNLSQQSFKFVKQVLQAVIPIPSLFRYNPLSKNLKKQTKRLKDAVWWNKCRVSILLIFLLLAIAVIATFSVCGLEFEKCRIPKLH